MLSNKFRILLLSILSLTLIACADEKEGPAEKAGKKVDETYQDVKKEAEELGDKMSERVEDMKDSAKDMADDVKDKAEEVKEDLDDNN